MNVVDGDGIGLFALERVCHFDPKFLLAVDRRCSEKAATQERVESGLGGLFVLGVQDELHLDVFAIGKEVAKHLRQRGFQKKFNTLLHYSALAQRARNAAISGHEIEFEAFRRAVPLADVRATAEKVLEPVPAWLREKTLRAPWLAQKTELEPQQLKLLFAYKMALDPRQAVTST